MIRTYLDKIGSAARTAGIELVSYLSREVVAEEGYVVAVRVLNDKAVYNLLENVHGRLMRIRPGDQIAGVLGHRRALRGYAGYVPETIAAGDKLNILNMGGVIGLCTSYAPDVGEPFEVEVLGAVLHFPYLGERIGEPAHIRVNAISSPERAEPPVPIVAVVGTCMDVGKTQAACQIIHGLSRRSVRVSGGKVTGVGLRRDVLNMIDHGAYEALSFLDAGFVSTAPETAPQATWQIVNRLSREKPEVIVLEFGDGLLGDYGVQAVLADRSFTSLIKAVVVCANDPVGAWGAVHLLKEKYGLSTHVVTGRVTDNEVGCAFAETQLAVPAANALKMPGKLLECVCMEVFGRVC